MGWKLNGAIRKREREDKAAKMTACRISQVLFRCVCERKLEKNDPRKISSSSQLLSASGAFFASSLQNTTDLCHWRPNNVKLELEQRSGEGDR